MHLILGVHLLGKNTPFQSKNRKCKPKDEERVLSNLEKQNK